jgi:dephospho-CoA kinase
MYYLLHIKPKTVYQLRFIFLSLAMKIVGITWTLGAGKGTVVEYMVKTMWFKHYSVRDYLEEELDKRWLEHTRDNMRELADGLRKEFGPSYVIDQMYKKASAVGADAIIESIRCIGEIDKLRRYADFFLLWVNAARKMRYESVIERWSSTDDVTYEQFCEQEDKEIHTTNPYEMNLVWCLERANIVIKNDGTVEQLYMEIERVFSGE